MKSTAEVLIRMETLDIIFAKRFIDAYELCGQGMQLAKSWNLRLNPVTI